MDWSNELDNINTQLAQICPTRLKHILEIGDRLSIAVIENGPHVLVPADPDYIAERQQKGIPLAQIFITHLFAALRQAVDVRTGERFDTSAFMPKPAPFSSNLGTYPDSRP